MGCGEPAAEAPTGGEGASPELWKDPDPRLARLLVRGLGDPLDREPPIIRVLVSYDASNYFVDSGRQCGLEYELMTGFEEFLAERSERVIPPRLVYIALPFQQLIQAVAEGRGDLAAAGLTITEERRRRVDFARPYRRGVREVLVRHRGAEPIGTARDLSGRSVQVVRASSYASHLARLNRELEREGLAPVRIEQADRRFQTEDLLQMVHAGIFSYTVADDHIALAWAEVLEGIVVEAASINEGGELAWALRKDNHRLREALDAYARSRRQGTFEHNLLFRRYYDSTRWIRNPADSITRGRLARLRPLLERYAAKYRLDWLALAAIAYQESGFDSQARSTAGAVGIMQVMPATARDANVAILDAGADDEANIHAGARYLAFLRNRYFSDESISPAARFDFTVAAYNAGPARVAQLRRTAGREGLDPNRWFGHVEHVARRVIGRETVEYVANVNKYYIAFRSLEAQLDMRRGG